MDREYIPRSMERSYITIPILKPGKDKSSPTNYRPISLANSLSKLLQKMVNRRLIWFLETKNLLIDEQCGFRQHRSTVDQIMLLRNEIETTFENKQHLIAITFDINKAYDTTWHRNILQALLELQVGGVVNISTRYNKKKLVKSVTLTKVFIYLEQAYLDPRRLNSMQII